MNNAPTTYVQFQNKESVGMLSVNQDMVITALIEEGLGQSPVEDRGLKYTASIKISINGSPVLSISSWNQKHETGGSPAFYGDSREEAKNKASREALKIIESLASTIEAARNDASKEAWVVSWKEDSSHVEWDCRSLRKTNLWQGEPPK